MKKILLVIVCLGILLSVAGCGKKTETAPESVPETETEEKSAEILQAEEESAFCAYFTDKLYAISQNYHPGTAGCSLTAAALAAEIMDLFTQYDPSTELIKSCMKEFTETMTRTALTEYAEQVDDIISSSGELTGENGKDLLDSCGYNGSGYPWDAKKMTDCFAAMKLS